jgi:hypothetical protein
MATWRLYTCGGFNYPKTTPVPGNTYADYLIGHDAPNSDLASICGSDVGQHLDFSFGWFSVFQRCGLRFPTDALPLPITINSGKVIVQQTNPMPAGQPDAGYAVHLVEGAGLVAPPIVADYGLLNTRIVSRGSTAIPVGGYPAHTDVNIALNALGLADISRVAYTTYGVRSNNDMNAIGGWPQHAEWNGLFWDYVFSFPFMMQILSFVRTATDITITARITESLLTSARVPVLDLDTNDVADHTSLSLTVQIDSGLGWTDIATFGYPALNQVLTATAAIGMYTGVSYRLKMTNKDIDLAVYGGIDAWYTAPVISPPAGKSNRKAYPFGRCNL